MVGVFKGLRYLHSIGVAHRDIKLENIMIATEIDENGKSMNVPKFIDFGLSKVLLKG